MHITRQTASTLAALILVAVAAPGASEQPGRPGPADDAPARVVLVELFTSQG